MNKGPGSKSRLSFHPKTKSCILAPETGGLSLIISEQFNRLFGFAEGFGGLYLHSQNKAEG